MNETPTTDDDVDAPVSGSDVTEDDEAFEDSMLPNYETKLSEIEADIQNGKAVFASPRDILAWFGAQRRGVNVVSWIKHCLTKHSLTTSPDFEYEYIDGVVSFKSTDATTSASGTEETPQESGSELNATDDHIDTVASPLNEGLITTDPTYRIGKLPAANNKPLTVKPSDSIEKAVTLMMEYDYSQLPVVTNPSTVEGLFTWESLATKRHFGHSPQEVGDCLARAHVISSELSIFDAVVEIARHDVALVRAKNKLITGIITTFDLSHQFRQLGEPFLLLSEIENQIRRLLDGCFSLAELQGIRDEADSDREVNGLSDLTFGEYLRLIENKENWVKLSIPLDRPEFVNKLDEVRVIRNSVMHFDPDGIAGDEIDTLRKFAGFLQRIANVKHVDTED
ncbi:MAG: CBS domain-containing protein [Planctomycetota bacterium]